MTSKDIQREYRQRLNNEARNRQALEIQQRMRMRRKLRKAIENAVKLDGSVQEFAIEFSGLVRNAEARLSGRSCC